MQLALHSCKYCISNVRKLLPLGRATQREVQRESSRVLRVKVVPEGY